MGTMSSQGLLLPLQNEISCHQNPRSHTKKKTSEKNKTPQSHCVCFFGGPTFTAFFAVFSISSLLCFGAKAMEILEEMPQSLVQMDLLSFNSAINSLERSDRWQQALDLLDVMQGAEVVASTVTYNAAISCLKTGAQNWPFFFSLFGKLTWQWKKHTNFP